MRSSSQISMSLTNFYVPHFLSRRRQPAVNQCQSDLCPREVLKGGLPSAKSISRFLAMAVNSNAQSFKPRISLRGFTRSCRKTGQWTAFLLTVKHRQSPNKESLSFSSNCSRDSQSICSILRLTAFWKLRLSWEIANYTINSLTIANHLINRPSAIE